MIIDWTNNYSYFVGVSYVSIETLSITLGWREVVKEGSKIGKIYKNQTALTIRLTTHIDITGATASIKYRKPSGTEGEWPGNIIDTTNGTIQYLIQSADDLDEAGSWTLWTHIVFATGEIALGEPFKMYVYRAGS